MLIAIVHALDNPFGSLSTTFEAAQAIMKLGGQSPKRMRDLSSLWVPPVYRRLLSADKAERDMVERCLIKVSCVILPPQPLLSKAVASDLEQKLLSCMVNMLDDPSKKVQTVKSWGWIVSLLGPDAVNNRPLLNKLIKVPEQMFTDLNPQVQVATMVSWKSLVDAFFPSQATEIVAQQTVISPLKPIEQASAQVKRIRLIMVPICRVLSRSRNIVLSSSCLSTWHYLLHRLGNLINYLPILEAAFGPILKIIFSFGINDQNKPLWSFCLNLFLDFVSSKNRVREDLCAPVNQNLLAQSCKHIKALLDIQHIKWLPWDISCFNFQLNILGIILKPELFQDIIPETMVIVMDSATEIFRFLLKGIQIELREQRAYEQVNECITNACKFAKRLLLDHVGKNSVIKCAALLEFGLRFMKVIAKELDHSLLASENIEVCLDIEHIKENQHAECSPKLSLPRIRSLSYMEMVSPAVYVTALSLSMISQYTGEFSHRDADELVSILDPSSDALENFHTAVSFMYMQIRRPTCNKERLKWLMVWNSFAKKMNSQIISYLETNSGLCYHDVLHQFFCYPILNFLYPKGISILLNAENSSESKFSVLQNLEMESTIEVYRSLSTNSCNSKFFSKVFFDGFYKYLVCTIDENMALFQANLEHLSEEFENASVLSALGEIVIGLLQNDQMLTYANQELKETPEDSSVCRQPELFLNCFKLANRFMKLSSFHFKANPAGQHQVTSRFFSSLSNFAGHLTLKEDVLLFEIIGDQLTEWLSLSIILYSEMQQGQIVVHLENLWLKMVECLKRSQLVSDVPLINQKHRLLQAALNRPHRPISVATASVCRVATHGNTTLHPGCLISEFAELLMHRRKALDSSRKTVITSNPTDLTAERYDGSVNVSVGLGRKRLKIMKYSTKPKELNKNRANMGISPGNTENRACRKPELILEMLQRKT
ncbi:uncharacterized protein [Zea mays]|nr:uncharacterized protein LOC103638009 isoform X3 [Zea mays]XP_035818357.1 uncharacterized protein LOC103638009 isoform X3 [Zea mays]AQL01697.1 Telomere-associated protein RIF1 [Zea mays]AQL01708.1 Telomere-associated protein RIF1 [Zea mays]|eukprot:XP_008659232.1 uncharacterized protein LOC103638009 isoform X2 [Zea mays]